MQREDLRQLARLINESARIIAAETLEKKLHSFMPIIENVFSSADHNTKAFIPIVNILLHEGWNETMLWCEAMIEPDISEQVQKSIYDGMTDEEKARCHAAQVQQMINDGA